MDISVSHLNNRLALQLPAELPLGLVFVVGEVENLSLATADSDNGTDEEVVSFDLVEAGYRLRCRAGNRALNGVHLDVGERIRAGGHLSFDTQQASYFLLARDIETVPTETIPLPEEAKKGGRTALTPFLADIKRRAEAAQLSPADLPDWVQKIAPVEVQAAVAETAVPKTTDTPQPDTASEREAEPTKQQLSDTLVSFLASAMEGEEEVELTPEIIEEVASVTSMPPSPAVQPYEIPPPLGETESESSDHIPPRPVFVPNPHRETDWLVVLLILSFLILTIAIVVASVLWLLR